jgi:hypothetical protein
VERASALHNLNQHRIVKHGRLPQHRIRNRERVIGKVFHQSRRSVVSAGKQLGQLDQDTLLHVCGYDLQHTVEQGGFGLSACAAAFKEGVCDLPQQLAPVIAVRIPRQIDQLEKT